MIKILFCEIKGKLPPDLWKSYFTILPAIEQERNVRYFQSADQHAHLLGRMLLRMALMQYGYPPDALHLLQFNAYQKPFINDQINFNISHSGKYVACAIGNGIKIGLDVELKSSGVNVTEFREIFSMPEWEYLNGARMPQDLFYKLWARKESVVKAIGQGLSMPLQEVDVLKDSIFLEEETWNLYDLDLDAAYSACLAANTANCKIAMTSIDFYANNLLNDIIYPKI